MIAVFAAAALLCFGAGFAVGRLHAVILEERDDKYEGCSTQELLKIVAENCDNCKSKRKTPKRKKAEDLTK